MNMKTRYGTEEVKVSEGEYSMTPADDWGNEDDDAGGGSGEDVRKR
ncbi:hypothetical protein E2C01_098886 [Portunus trituberculatus]|uniref:Uncharacterized protein n=1 Tax=Portunus trituberculatus TaxID=210409 RepID=A0A5B7KE02_PORTR|nr:hypothetical protein [Portunus trituberculatus]